MSEKLILAKSPEKKLEVELPDGNEVAFKIKRITWLEASHNDKLLREAQSRYDKGEIDSIEQLSISMGLLVDNWEDIKQDVIDSGIELDHTFMLLEKIRELQGQKDTEQKKTQ